MKQQAQRIQAQTHKSQHTYVVKVTLVNVLLVVCALDFWSPFSPYKSPVTSDTIHSLLPWTCMTGPGWSFTWLFLPPDEPAASPQLARSIYTSLLPLLPCLTAVAFLPLCFPSFDPVKFFWIFVSAQPFWTSARCHSVSDPSLSLFFSLFADTNKDEQCLLFSMSES